MKYPLFRVAIDTESALNELEQVLDSGFVNEGIQVSKFQETLCSQLGVKNVVIMNSCTSALTVAYKLAGVEFGSEVVTTPMTCIATNTPIINLGGKIVWCDINAKSGNIDPNCIEELITEKTKAIAYVNWAGNPAEVEAIWEIGKKYEIKVIQDAAHSYGALWKGKSVSEFADFTCFSFQAIKHLSCGDGGALICQNDDDYILARKLKWFGYDRESVKNEQGEWRGQRWSADVKKYEIGYKFNMNNISAAIGLSSSKNVQERIAIHRKNADLYNRAFSNFQGITPLEMPQEATSSYWTFPLILSNQNKNIRDAILDQLNSLGIGAGLIHLPNDNYEAFEESRTNLPGVRSFEEAQMSLPCGWWLDERDIDYISNKTKEILLSFS